MRVIQKSPPPTTQCPHQKATLRINNHKYSQSHTGKTVAPPAYNRPTPPAIHHPTNPPHLEQTQRQTTNTHPHPSTQNHPALPPTQPHRTPTSRLLQIPTWSWPSEGKTNFSGKHKRTGFNHQVICTLDGKLLAITDPTPGARHDAFVLRAHGLGKYLDETTLADKGYVGLRLATPVKRLLGCGLSGEVRRNNRVLNRLRLVVERVIAQV